MPSKTAAEKKPSVKHSFYGGRSVIEAKPWGDHFRFTVSVGGEVARSGVLSATGITKMLDKSQALLPWAVGLVGSHVTSTFQSRDAQTFTKDEIFLVVAEAILKPEEAKVAGGKTGDVIHDFAHDFARAQMNGTDNPKLPDLSEMPVEEREKSLKGIGAFLEWFNTRDVEFLALEKLVYYNSSLAGDTREGEGVIEYLGIMDCLARVDGEILVLDYKTGKRVYTDQRYQLSGYFKAWNSNSDNVGMQAGGSAVLSFSKETGDLTICPISRIESLEDYDAFRGLYFVARREKKIEADRARESKEAKAK